MRQTPNELGQKIWAEHAMTIALGVGQIKATSELHNSWHRAFEAERKESDRLREDLKKEIETIKPLLDELLKLTSPLPQEPSLLDRMTGFVQHLRGCDARESSWQPCSCGLRNLMVEYSAQRGGREGE